MDATCTRCGSALGPAADWIDRLCAECEYARLDGETEEDDV